MTQLSCTILWHSTGFAVQSNIKWDVHCKQIAAKATNTLNVLKQNLKSTNEVRKKAYKSLVRPQVQYAASVWCPWLASDKSRIERVQRRAARYVCNTISCSRYSSVTTMLQPLNWESLQSSTHGKYASVHYLQSLLQPGNVSFVGLCNPLRNPHPRP